MSGAMIEPEEVQREIDRLNGIRANLSGVKIGPPNVSVIISGMIGAQIDALTNCTLYSHVEARYGGGRRENQRQAAHHALSWKCGDTRVSPSQTWHNLLSCDK